MDEERRLDWDEVDEGLYVIPQIFKNPRFDSLKHVLTVLGAVDSEAALEEVRHIQLLQDEGHTFILQIPPLPALIKQVGAQRTKPVRKPESSVAA